VALTGGLPDLSDWSSKVPVRLSESVKLWKLCETVPLQLGALNAS